MTEPSKKIRVALATTELAVGGAERCLTNLALNLNRDRFEPVVYSLAPPPNSERSELVDQLKAAGIPVRFLGLRARWRFFAAIRRLSDMLAEQAPDVLQTFLFHANTVGVIAARRANVPRIVTGIRVSDPRRWRHWFERRLAQHVDQIVCVSNSVAHFSEIQAGLPAGRLLVIPNGIDVTPYDGALPADLSSLGIGAERLLITSIGRLNPQKGLDQLLTIAPRFLESLPQHDLLLVGDGPQGPALRAQAQRDLPAGRIHFAGWRKDIAAILRRSALLVLPSRWEGMPNVLLEAMAARIPVVAARVEGVEEILGSLAEHQSVAPGDDDAFIRQVVEIVLMPEAQRVGLGEKNRQRVLERFSLQAMIQAYEGLYERLVKGR